MAPDSSSTPTTACPASFDMASSAISICVFCGAGDGNDPVFAQSARDLADLFHQNNWSLGTAKLFLGGRCTNCVQFTVEERTE